MFLRPPYANPRCVYEISEAMKVGCKVEVACSLDYVNTGAGNLQDLLQARTEEARCKSQDDEEWIRSRVTEKMRWLDLDNIIFKFRYDALRKLMQRHADKLKSTIAAELKNLCAMPPREKKQSAKAKPEVCLSKPPSSGVAKAAEEEKKQEGVMQRFCSIFASMFAPPPTLVESAEEPVEPRHDSF